MLSCALDRGTSVYEGYKCARDSCWRQREKACRKRATKLDYAAKCICLCAPELAENTRYDVVAECKKMDAKLWSKETLRTKYGSASWPHEQDRLVPAGYLDMLDCEQIQVVHRS